MRVYLSGPMRGIPRYNFPEFDSATAALRQAGFTVVSPAEHDREVDDLYAQREGFEHGLTSRSGPTFSQLIGWDLEQLSRPGYIDAIFLLPGWEYSVGVEHELYVSRVVGKQVFYLVKGGASLHEPTRWTWYPEGAGPLIIGLSGYAQAGKDTAGRTLVAHAGFERVAFADALKDVLYALDPLVTYGGMWPLSTVIDLYGWEYAKSSVPGVRELLQRLGTEAGRHILGDDIWVRTALTKVSEFGGRYVFTDVRFPNEYAAIKAAGGEVWRIIRDGTEPVNAHVSETALDNHTIDRYIVNNGTIEDLETRVLRAISEVFVSRLEADRVDAT